MPVAPNMRDGRTRYVSLRAAARLAAVVLTLVLLSCSSPRAAGPDDGAAIWPPRRTSEEWRETASRHAAPGESGVATEGAAGFLGIDRWCDERAGLAPADEHRTSVRCGRATRRPIAEVTHHPTTTEHHMRKLVITAVSALAIT